MSPHVWNLIFEYIHQFQIIGNNINYTKFESSKGKF